MTDQPHDDHLFSPDELIKFIEEHTLKNQPLAGDTTENLTTQEPAAPSEGPTPEEVSLPPDATIVTIYLTDDGRTHDVGIEGPMPPRLIDGQYHILQKVAIPDTMPALDKHTLSVIRTIAGAFHASLYSIMMTSECHEDTVCHHQYVPLIAVYATGLLQTLHGLIEREQT